MHARVCVAVDGGWSRARPSWGRPCWRRGPHSRCASTTRQRRRCCSCWATAPDAAASRPPKCRRRCHKRGRGMRSWPHGEAGDYSSCRADEWPARRAHQRSFAREPVLSWMSSKRRRRVAREDGRLGSTVGRGNRRLDVSRSSVRPLARAASPRRRGTARHAPSRPQSPYIYSGHPEAVMPARRQIFCCVPMSTPSFSSGRL